jgi:HK97 family phage major capsid protein
MALEQAVADAIAAEVKKFGDDVTGLRDSMQRDLTSVRTLAESTKGAIGPEVKSQIDALSASVTEKSAAIEKTLQARIDGLEKKMNRPNLGGDGEALEMKSFVEFNRIALARRGQLVIGVDPAVLNFDAKSVKDYASTFGTYMRRDRDTLAPDQMKAMSVGSDPDGGYWVTPEVSARLLKIVFESSPMREIATVETISTDAIEYPVDEGEADCGWVGETATRTETNTPQVGVQRIPVHELYANPKATQKLLEDASINVEAWLAQKVGEKFGRTEATAFVSGNGIKKPRGFLDYGSGTTRGTLEQVNSGAAADVTFDGLLNLTNALKEFYHAGAVFLMRRATVGKVLLLKDGNGQYLWRPDMTAGKPSTLIGYPVYQAADMPAVGAGNLAIAFGNFKVGYTIVDRLGITTLRDPYTATPFVKFYTRKRVGGDVVNFEAIKIQKIAA